MSDGLPTLMRAQMAAEFAQAHRTQSTLMTTAWNTTPPPEPGWYLVSAHYGEGQRSVRLDHWNGLVWPHIGGYATYEAWMPIPDVYLPTEELR